jgi:1-deoxy-D-xylulose-5-phosphate reductoisomerase
MVQFCDGSVIAQLGYPDMRVPIQLAITYPHRRKSPVSAPNWAEVKALTFDKPDFDRFPSLLMGYRAAREGGTLGAVLNAANEVAVDRFCEAEISFLQVFDLVSDVMDAHGLIRSPSLDEVLEADRWAREKARQWRR